jgi:hypothetical protein
LRSEGDYQTEQRKIAVSLPPSSYHRQRS